MGFNLNGKHKSGFTAVLAGITILSLLIQALNYFGIIDLNQYLSAIVAMMLGFGLLIEGNVRGIISMLRGKANGVGLVHFLTGFLGIIVLVGGVVELLGVGLPSSVMGIIGLAFVVSAVMVVVEFFV